MASTQSSAGFGKRNKRRSGGELGEGGTVWELAATSLHNDVLLDSAKCHDWAASCAHAYDDALVGSFGGAGGGNMARQISYRVGCH